MVRPKDMTQRDMKICSRRDSPHQRMGVKAQKGGSGQSQRLLLREARFQISIGWVKNSFARVAYFIAPDT